MKFTATRTKTCELCGDEFTPTSRNQRFCKKTHTRPCPICGGPVTIKYKSDKEKCCSKECTLKLKKSIWMNNWGVDNPAKAQPIKDKQAATCLERYDVSTPFLMADFPDKSKATSREKYNTDYPMQSPIFQNIRKQSCLRNSGYDEPLKIPYVRDAQKSVYQDPARAAQAAKKRAESSQCVASDGTHLDSKYELDVYEFCLRNNIAVERQVPITFTYQGAVRNVVVDFKIEDTLFECKGSHLLEGCFDHAPNMIPINVKLDVYKKNDVILITDNLGRDIFGKPNSTTSNGLKYKHKCPEPLIGVDIELFGEPEFPYRDDRPKCFYDVKVDGQMSSYEAFYDEKIRWKMIKNRIQYSGGFIDASQVLNALNITRTCKQPSWFSKSLAKHIIEEYCSSDVIVDPFAGWGARADAANELHRTYIGCDFNQELVEWHHSKGRTNIAFKDANEFKYNGKCSVFICPPYSDPATGRCFEDYNFDGFDASAKAITQCQWLQIVMNNVPNASEYIMVCKVVDSGWEQYIVDTKINKSHFGINNEYILVVKA